MVHVFIEEAKQLNIRDGEKVDVLTGINITLKDQQV